jgi:predicted HAD superfamily hydrolase
MNVFSFDIFDTCLIRACGNPCMVFSLLAQQFNSDKAFIADFIKRRIQAEADARIQFKKETVTIDEIYDCFDVQSINQSKSNLINSEQAIEEQMLYPVYEILEQINNIHNEGNSVIFISDMYLSSEFLKKILYKFGFWRDKDYLFVSGECGYTKTTGNLFQYISQTLNIRFKDWHHYGDNPVGDFKIPKKLGIKAHIIKSTYSRYEQDWLEKASLSFNSEMCKYFAGVTRAIRLSNKKDERINIAANVIAPLYIPFVFHVLNDAQKKGITQLYFTARDSFIFYKIAQRLSNLFPKIKLFYIHLSRRALWLPSLYNCDYEDLDCIGENIEERIPEKLLKMFNISISEISEYVEISPAFWSIPLTKEQIPMFYDVLLNSSVKKIISNKSLNARNLLLAYLKQEQMLDNSHSAIVDLGWHGSSRYTLNKILLKEGYKSIYTYYWGISSNRLFYNYQNPYDAYVYVEELYSLFNSSLINSLIMEHYFSVTMQSSTISYINDNNIIKPVFNDENINFHADEICEINVKIMEQMIDVLLKFPNIENQIKFSFNICGLHSLNIFFLNPTYDEIKVLKGLKFENPLSNDGFIINSLHLWNILLLLLFDYGKNICWKAGSLVALSPFYGNLLCSINQKIANMKFVKLLKLYLKKFINKRQ